MQRIMEIGGAGSGKSTLARRIGDRLGLPVVHLDQLHFLPGWIERPAEARDQELIDITGRSAWMIDGNYSSTWPQRLNRADCVLWIDIPVLTRVWRVLRRASLRRSTA